MRWLAVTIGFGTIKWLIIASQLHHLCFKIQGSRFEVSSVSYWYSGRMAISGLLWHIASLMVHGSRSDLFLVGFLLALGVGDLRAFVLFCLNQPHGFAVKQKRTVPGCLKIV